jgi:hypothetical protein
MDLNSNNNFLKWNKYNVRQPREIFHLKQLNKNNEFFNKKISMKNVINEKTKINSIKNDNVFIEKDTNITSIQQKYNELMIKKDCFDWIQYLKNNPDLVNILDRHNAWHHWVTNGQYEGRELPIVLKKNIINDTTIHHGRLGNLFFINMILHFIASKYDLKVKYKYYESFTKLGIGLYIGTKTYESSSYLTEYNYMDLINENTIFTNIIITNYIWFHNYEVSLLLRIHFNDLEIKKNIINKNIFKERYNNNNDIFIHIRMGDIEVMNMNNSYEYYSKLLSKYSYENGYISSDNINSDLCVRLINEYNLKMTLYREEETIMFGSTCNTIILSGGTFSWMIGFFAYFSKNIIYPINQNRWYGNIFVYDDWIGEEQPI